MPYEKPPSGEEATSSAIAFALAGVLFIAAISTVLVYANDRIPPPTKSRPHDELSAEARVLLHQIVLDSGTETWDGNKWEDGVDGPATNPELPGLRCTEAVIACTNAVVLDLARVEHLQLYPATSTGNDGLYSYDELRGLAGLTDRGRDFRVTITRTDMADTLLDFCKKDTVTLTCVNPNAATRPAVSYVQVYDSDGGVLIPVRVSLHVFLVCDEGECLAAS